MLVGDCVVALAGVYALRLADVIDNWPFVILSIVAVGVGRRRWPAWPSRRRSRRPPASPRPSSTTSRSSGAGIDRPWTEADVDELDRELGLSEVELHGAA